MLTKGPPGWEDTGFQFFLFLLALPFGLPRPAPGTRDREDENKNKINFNPNHQARMVFGWMGTLDGLHLSVGPVESCESLDSLLSLAPPVFEAELLMGSLGTLYAVLWLILSSFPDWVRVPQTGNKPKLAVSNRARMVHGHCKVSN